jgi:hypothetical protein
VPSHLGLGAADSAFFDMEVLFATTPHLSELAVHLPVRNRPTSEASFERGFIDHVGREQS